MLCLEACHLLSMFSGSFLPLNDFGMLAICFLSLRKVITGAGEVAQWVRELSVQMR